MADKLTYDKLPLPFGTLIGSDRDAARLRIPFDRLLGYPLGDVDNQPPAPENPTKPIDPRFRSVSASWSMTQGTVTTDSLSVNATWIQQSSLREYQGVNVDVLPLSGCGAATVSGVVGYVNERVPTFSQSETVKSYYDFCLSDVSAHSRCVTLTSGKKKLLTGAVEALFDGANIKNCVYTHQSASIAFSVYTLASISAQLDMSGDRRHTYLPALSIPCEYYEIELEPEVPANTYVCGIRPPSDRLNLDFTRRRIAYDAATLPLSFDCYQRAFTPVLRAYMINNVVSATLSDGRALNLLSADFTADMDGYYWQGSITLPPDDFTVLDMLNASKGDEPLIKVNINGDSFVFMAEEYRDNRIFGKKTYTVSGRSVTARMGDTYAQAGSGTYRSPMYAQQIAAEQLKYSRYSLEHFLVPDWLVPADVYSISDKSPVAVLADIASAAGGFLESHPNKPYFSIRPRWPVAAWDVVNSEPDVVVPASVILSASGSKRVKPKANGVWVWAEHNKGRAADVYRKGSNREPRASALTHPLYTDNPVLSAAGIAALSDTGAHKIEQIKLPVSAKYALPCAKLGQIWQVNEPSGAWKGVVTGVSLGVSVERDVPVVYQTVTIDCYLDN
ncbi:hypothetical protein [Neisseria sp. S1]|uniref:hypothetical protein n=1 Tax=Neisseria sp. S1 TaxID=3318354 RepID=UPI003A8764D8